MIKRREVLSADFLPTPPTRSGKVRELFDLGDSLLIMATDRLSAFDVIMPNGIPGKGVLLTQIAAHWFELTGHLVPNHVLTMRVEELPEPFCHYPEQLAGRVMLGKKVEIFPIECVVRGYLAGSGWKEYQQTGMVCGHQLPPGLRESGKLPEPIFTPATKAVSGHDENITEPQAEAIVGTEAFRTLKAHSLALYNFAARKLKGQGVIIADTKFEFGQRGKDILLADEILTPDSSRFWPADEYEPGRSQHSFDKQFVRDYLETLDWNKTPPGPVLPGEIVETTFQKYLTAYQIITGNTSPFGNG